jgi:hypothetical protein
MNELPATRLTPEGLFSVQPCNSIVLLELLENYERELALIGIQLSQRLRPGLTSSSIVETVETELGFTPTEELVTWFGWHDGFRPPVGGQAPIQVIPFIRPSSLQGAVDKYRIGQSLGKLAWYWAPHWLMIEDGLHGYSVSCEEIPAKTPIVRFVDEDNPPLKPQYRAGALSLCTLVTWWLELLRNGGMTFDGVKWNFDSSKYSEAQAESYLLT